MSRLFPELDGAPGGAEAPARPAPEEAAPRDAGPVRPPAEPGSAPGPAAGGTAVRAGEAAIARFEQLLGVGPRIRALGVQPSGAVTIEIDLGREGVVRLALVPPGERAWRAVAGFGVQYAGAKLHPALEAVLARFLARHRATPLAALRALVQPDPEDADRIVWDDPDSLVYSYGTSRAWRTFFEEVELYRGVCEKFAGNVVEVSHNELECHYSGVTRTERAISFFNAVALDRPARDADDPGNRGYYVTDLSDLDVIKGGDAKLDAALASLEAMPEKPDMVLVTSTCVPIVTGDDFEAAARRASGKLGLPVIVVGNHNNPQEVMVERALADLAAQVVPKRPGSVNLIGMPRVIGFEALVALLARAGVSINAEVYPDLDPVILRRLPAAELSVVYGWDRYARAAERLVAALPMPAIRPPPPFGGRGSRAFCMAVAEGLGLRDAMESAWEEAWAPLAPVWDELRGVASAYRLGFVLGDDASGRELAEGRCLGVPVLDLVEEAGFGVDLYVYAGRRSAGARGGAPGRRVFSYASREDLERLLREADAVAFYSEMSFDRRLTRTGRNAFSLRDFEIGPAGAVGTLRRLVAACRLSFFRSYRDYLGRPFGPGGAA